MATNNTSQITNDYNDENLDAESDDKVVNVGGNDASIETQKPIKKFLAALGALAVMFAIFLIYREASKKVLKAILRLSNRCLVELAVVGQYVRQVLEASLTAHEKLERQFLHNLVMLESYRSTLTRM